MGSVKFSLSFKEKDLGWKKLQAELKKLESNPHVKVGVQGKKGMEVYPGTNLTVADVATINEFGAPGKNPPIPARPLFRNCERDNRGKWTYQIGRLFGQVLTGGSDMNVEKALRIIGEMAKGDLQTYFTDPGFKGTVPNTKATIERKGSSQPLIDTGRYRGSITYVLVLRKGKEEDAK